MRYWLCCSCFEDGSRMKVHEIYPYRQAVRWLAGARDGSRRVGKIIQSSRHSFEMRIDRKPEQGVKFWIEVSA